LNYTRKREIPILTKCLDGIPQYLLNKI